MGNSNSSNLKHGQPHSRPQGVAAISIEMEGFGHSFGNSRGGDHSGQGIAVADALGHGDDVGHHAMAFETPEMLPSTTKSCLHLWWKLSFLSP